MGLVTPNSAVTSNSARIAAKGSIQESVCGFQEQSPGRVRASQKLLDNIGVKYVLLCVKQDPATCTTTCNGSITTYLPKQTYNRKHCPDSNAKHKP